MYCFALILWFCCGYNTSSLYEEEQQAWSLYKRSSSQERTRIYRGYTFVSTSVKIDPQARAFNITLLKPDFIPMTIEISNGSLNIIKKPSELDAIKLLRIYHCRQKTEMCDEYERVILFRQEQQVRKFFNQTKLGHQQRYSPQRTRPFYNEVKS